MKRRDAQGLTASQRAILDRLKAVGPMTTQELCAELELSRDGARKAVNGLHAAKGRYHTRIACCNLFDLVGLKNERPTK